jgi:hypothetical protein
LNKYNLVMNHEDHLKKTKHEGDIRSWSKGGLMFDDGCVKTICDLELKIFGHCSIAFGVQAYFLKF